LLARIKLFSDKVISRENNFDYLKEYIYYSVKWTSIDLFLFWSQGVRITKKISLKSLGIQLGYPVVMELPYEPNKVLSEEEIEHIKEYNTVHDLGILHLLSQKQKEEISLRKNIYKETGINCMSYDAPKIANQVLLQDYTLKKIEKGDITKDQKEEFIKTTNYQRFARTTIYIKDILQDFDPKFELPIFQDLYKRILNSIDNFSEELHVNINNTNILLSYGVGGLHSIQENEMYNSSNKEMIVSSDVVSMYPNMIINYNCIRYPEVLERYFQIKSERVVAKKQGNKKKDVFYKLILNG